MRGARVEGEGVNGSRDERVKGGMRDEWIGVGRGEEPGGGEADDVGEEGEGVGVEGDGGEVGGRDRRVGVVEVGEGAIGIWGSEVGEDSGGIGGECGLVVVRGEGEGEGGVKGMEKGRKVGYAEVRDMLMHVFGYEFVSIVEAAGVAPCSESRTDEETLRHILDALERTRGRVGMVTEGVLRVWMGGLREEIREAGQMEGGSHVDADKGGS